MLLTIPTGLLLAKGLTASRTTADAVITLTLPAVDLTETPTSDIDGDQIGGKAISNQTPVVDSRPAPDSAIDRGLP